MRIVFFGTPDFARVSLDAILDDGRFPVAAVVTRPDRRSGRGQQIHGSPVKERAAAAGVVPILQPERLRDPEFHECLRVVDAECFVVVAFRILPAALFEMPARGAFNLHASLLPKYRGAAPIQHALFNGERETGVTTFLLERRVDTGRVLLSETVPIEADDDAGALHDRLAVEGAGLVLRTLELIAAGRATGRCQDDAVASAAPKITRDDLWLDFRWNADRIRNRVRGLSPLPGAAARLGERELKILQVGIVGDATGAGAAVPGDIVGIRPEEGPVVAVGVDGEERLLLQRVKPAGKKAMSGGEFVRGYRPSVGERFSVSAPDVAVQKGND